jgi:hypothetical protein
LKTTRGLGLKYLWVDSICIIQDDQEDWAREASKMAEIYANAHVVLAATAAKDCTEGFLHSRKAPLTIQLPQGYSKDFTFQARLNNSHSCGSTKRKPDYPLFLRGWCMQERFLARRIIHFLPDEVLFECLTHRSCECEFVYVEDKYPTISEACGEFRALKNANSLSAVSNLRFGRSWALIIREYKSLALTYQTDILPALSGVARSLEHLDLGRYIAGFWEYDIIFQLGWCRIQI